MLFFGVLVVVVGGFVGGVIRIGVFGVGVVLVVGFFLVVIGLDFNDV